MLAFVLGSVLSVKAIALGLGDLTLNSFLNEPLRARVDLLDTTSLDEDQIRIRLATTEDFDRLGLDRSYFLTTLDFEVVVDPQGGSYIEITSDEPVLEPYLDFIIEARWPSGRLLREYTVLVDPPAYASGTRVISARQEIMAPTGEDAAKKSQREQTEVTTGTVVQVDGSESAPAPSQSRSFGSDASEQPASGDKYLIRRNDTLWTIASRARPSGATVQQTMLEIQRLNPEAFIDGNINRIKAGYVIYLPNESEIGTGALEAEQEVASQNTSWREGTPPAARLRISSEPEEGGDPQQIDRLESQVAREQESLEAAIRDNDELTDRLLAVEDQVATLERIISLKDDQIAALQSALADAETLALESVEDIDSLDAPILEAVDDVEQSVTDVADEQVAVAPADEQSAQPERVAAPAPVMPAAEEKGWLDVLMDNLLYVGGVFVALLLAIMLWMRRRGEHEEDFDDSHAEDDSAFSDVQLAGEESVLIDEVDSDDEAEAAEQEDDTDLDDGGERGYGGRKHDQYADDVETGDALAEADIYIAYGRYPQAVELLKNAINSDPANAAYRVKLVELAATMNDRFTAQQQLSDLKALGSQNAIERARLAVAEVAEGETWLVSLPPSSLPPELHGALADEDAAGDLELHEGDLELDLDSDIAELQIEETEPQDAEAQLEALATDTDGGQEEVQTLDLAESAIDELTSDTGDNLEHSFGELAVEGTGDDDLEEDLDLSADFNTDDNEDDDESLVFASETDEASTKLDLARAYLDMGDEDGARQILEEVIADGSGPLREEARALLEQLG